MLQSNENRILCDFVAECTPAMDSDRDQSVNNYYDIIYYHTLNWGGGQTHPPGDWCWGWFPPTETHRNLEKLGD